MTLKYESELLFDLMKRDGDDAPSDVLPYESELKEKYLNQVVGAYPKLQDYRPEWLNYNLYHYLPSDFPVESVANVTSASFNNVVPYAYKSAILSGQTMVNLIGKKREYVNQQLYGWEFMLPYNLTSGKTYLAIFDVTGTIDESNAKVYLMDYEFGSNSGNTSSTVPTFRLGHNVVKCVATNDNHRVLRIRTIYNENEKFTLSNVILIEYQDGMENWGIPFFEGMQSVQMPVLKSTGKNLFDVKDFAKKCGGTVNGNEYDSTTSKTNAVYDIFIPNGYIISYTATQLATDGSPSSSAFAFIGESGKSYHRGLNNFSRFVITAPENLIGIRIVNYCLNWKFSEFQIEEGMQETSYEPYKSNIITVNEEVTLRKVGDVQDELNLSTGELTQRIGEVVLDGSESWNKWGTNSFLYRGSIRVNATNNKILSDKLPVVNYNDIYECTTYGIGSQHGNIAIRINNVASVEDLKMFLSQNPITVQYPLAEESIETVDLSCINEQGESETFRPIEGTMHVSTSSQTLPPLLDMSVPVEATTQNLMSFANIVEEE